MISVGVDIEDISRFKDKTLENAKAFLDRIFTEEELKYCFSKKTYASSLCARFCAKEAVVKALSSLYQEPIFYKDIEILRKDYGAPYINIKIEELKKYNFSLSLSHEREKAIAFVVISN